MSRKHVGYIVGASVSVCVAIGALFLTSGTDSSDYKIRPSVSATPIESKTPFLELPAPSVSDSVPPLPTAPACPSGPEECIFN